MKQTWLMVAALVVSGAAFAQTEKKLIAADAESSDRIGGFVSVDGNTVLIGAPSDDDGGLYSGSAYVFVRGSGGRWTQQAKLTHPIPYITDSFGSSVSLWSDTALIGVPNDDDAGIDAGTVFVFTRNAVGSWTQQAQLSAVDTTADDWLGRSVSVYGDTALVGAPGDDDSALNSGSVYVFIRDGGGTWSQQAKLTAADAGRGDVFGRSVSIDTDTAVIGAPADKHGFVYSGSAYVFIRDTGGTWSQQAKLTAADAEEDDSFGASVSIAGDTAVIGAHQDDDGGSDSGSAYVFVRDAGGTWSQQAKLTASDAAADDSFGYSVSIDGDIAVIGAWGDEVSSGSVYLFRRNAGAWEQTVKLTASDSEVEDKLGFSVSLDGGTAVTGASGDDDGGINAGAVYVFSGGPIADLFSDGFESGDTTAWPVTVW